MPKPVLTAHQIELRAKLHTRCETVNRQNQTRSKLMSGIALVIEVAAGDMPINCRSIKANYNVSSIDGVLTISDRSQGV